MLIFSGIVIYKEDLINYRNTFVEYSTEIKDKKNNNKKIRKKYNKDSGSGNLIDFRKGIALKSRIFNIYYKTRYTEKATKLEKNKLK